MKKKIFAIAIMMTALAASTPVFAQNNDCKAAPACTENNCAAGDKVKKAQNPFEGLNLTADSRQSSTLSVSSALPTASRLRNRQRTARTATARTAWNPTARCAPTGSPK